MLHHNQARFAMLPAFHPHSATSYISLNYNLGEAKTGYEILVYINENDIKVEHINIHSDHSVGIPKMKEYVWNNFPDVSLTNNPLNFK